MTVDISPKSFARLDAVIESILRIARVPGAAIAVVVAGKTRFARGYGYRDLHAKLPMTADTVYPIASTTKSINASLLGMMVDEGRLGWDVPVQHYLPRFCLGDPLVSAQVTLRDLITMRTGLPRHDWLWLGNAMSREDLVARMRFLELSSGFRERFQYCNLTPTAAGHVAEVVMGRTWEELVRERILEPLGMHSSHLCLPAKGNTTVSYHETSSRELIPTVRLAADATAPAGGALHSTVDDMARWIAFNLNSGTVGHRALIRQQTLAEIQSPQVAVGRDRSAPTPGAMYAMGWFVDRYKSHTRLTHGGYLHDVNSEVTLFPQCAVGIVSTTNYGCPRLARLINQDVFDALMGFPSSKSVEEKLAEYEASIEEIHRCRTAACRIEGTSTSHDPDDYTGSYAHPAYGLVEIHRLGQDLVLKRAGLTLPLRHWHYDVWVARDTEMFPIHEPHPFDAANRIIFDMDVDGAVAGISLRFEPALQAIRFRRAGS